MEQLFGESLEEMDGASMAEMLWRREAIRKTFSIARTPTETFCT